MISSNELMTRVKGNVNFVKFANSELWYVCEDGFEFPIPLSDTAGAEFAAKDKGLFFMRWIKQHMKMLDEAKDEYTYHPREDGANVDFAAICASHREGNIE